MRGVVRGLSTFLFLLAMSAGTHALASAPPPDLAVFVRAGCPHFEAAKEFLHEFKLALCILALIQEEDLPQQDAQGILLRTLGMLRVWQTTKRTA